MPTSRHPPPRPDETDWPRARAACARRFGRFPNVLGVGVGLKYTDGQTDGQTLCLQFYVRRKTRRPPPRGHLPAFILARRPDGSADRARRLPTDVIELRGLRFACAAGSPLAAPGRGGALTLLFRNRAPEAPGRYLLTCAHVAGDVARFPPPDARLTLPRRNGPPLAADTLAHTTLRLGRLAYDIALAQLRPSRPPPPGRRVCGADTELTGFLDAADLRPGRALACAFPVSNVPAARVASARLSLPLALGRHTCLTDNLFLIDRPPRPGDSGGLLYDGPLAAGILVGLADGWGLFQPLGEAFAALQALADRPLRCFNDKTPTKGHP